MTPPLVSYPHHEPPTYAIVFFLMATLLLGLQRDILIVMEIDMGDTGLNLVSGIEVLWFVCVCVFCVLCVFWGGCFLYGFGLVF